MEPIFSALHIGVNQVDPASYVSPPRVLAGAENDAYMLAERTRHVGLMPRILVGASATRAKVVAALGEAAATLQPGALFVLTFSGHGAQDADDLGPTKDEEVDGLDEVWCLADDFIIDDELHACFSAFRYGVRILIISDSCHSGTMNELAPPIMEAPAGTFAARDYPRARAIPSLHARGAELAARAEAAKARGSTEASVILLAACKDDQYAYEDGDHGVFTRAFCSLWDRAPAVGHRDFVAALAATCPGQTPVYTAGKPEDTAFERQFPLTVAPPQR